MGNSKIEWTDKTWNPVTGCSPISTGCKNCYAQRFAERMMVNPMVKKYRNGFRVTQHEESLREPDGWKKPCKIFVCSMGDLFHVEVKRDFIDKIMEVIERNPRHTFQILTKRPSNMASYFKNREIPENCWIGTSVEDRSALIRAVELVNIDHAKKFISFEPLLGEIFDTDYKAGLCLDGIKWMIVGGESGYGARECEKKWVESLKWYADKLSIPFFFKQWGTWYEKKYKVMYHYNLLNGERFMEFPKEG